MSYGFLFFLRKYTECYSTPINLWGITYHVGEMDDLSKARS